MPRPFRFPAACCLLALLAGCATTPAPRPLPASTAGIEAFSLAGRVGVRLDGKGYSANLRWQHREGRDAVRLLSPVGSVIADLEADDRGAVLTTADRDTHRSNSVEALTRQVLGWDLPLGGLRHWVLARADPQSPAESETRDARGRLSQLAQDGWRITYPAYSGDSGLPARMTLVREHLTLRLVIDRWDLPE